MLNPYTWEQRVQHILDHDNTTPLFELEEVKPSVATIYLLTDDKNKIYAYFNGRCRTPGGMDMYMLSTAQFQGILEIIYKEIKKRYHIVRIEAFIPYTYLRNLYFPYHGYAGSQGDFHKRLFKASRRKK